VCGGRRGGKSGGGGGETNINWMLLLSRCRISRAWLDFSAPARAASTALRGPPPAAAWHDKRDERGCNQ